MTVYAPYGAAYTYGDASRLYGAGVSSSLLVWGLDIDWTGTGVYSGTNEASNMVGMRIRRGRQTYLNIDTDGNATGFEPVRVGTLTLTLDNTSRRYDPYNTTSPLYPYVIPGRYIRLRVLYNGTIYNVFHGKIRNITSIDNEDTQQVQIEAEDGLRLLQSADASVSMQTGISIDTAIGNVLADVNYPSLFGTDLDASADTLAYWWADGKAANEIRNLADAELGNFSISADGAATFKSRHHSTSAVLTLTSADFLKQIDVPQPLEVIRNAIKLYAHPRIQNSGVELWRLQDKPLVASLASLTVWASYAYGGNTIPAINVISPVTVTDYTMNTLDTGAGSDLTAQFTVDYTDFGKTGKIVLTNTSGSAGYITLLKVRGDAITAPDASLLIQEDAASQTAYGRALLTLDNNWYQDTTLADSITKWLASYMPNPQRFVTVRLEARPDIQFTPDLFDLVNVTIGKLSIAGVNYNVAGIEHEWIVNNGQATRTTWILEPKPNNSSYWIFTTTMGVTSKFGI